MNINKNNTIIVDHYQVMSADGTCDEQPTEQEIKDYLWSKRWIANRIKITYDDFDKKWWWKCKIS